MARIIIDRDICKGCGLCVYACPKKIIKIDETILNSKGYNPAVNIDMDSCVGCAACAIFCPDSAITVER